MNVTFPEVSTVPESQVALLTFPGTASFSLIVTVPKVTSEAPRGVVKVAFAV